jgi:hypothetical protein
MAVYLINYKLRTPLKDYQPFHAAVKTMANGWFSYFDDSWLINTNLSPKEIAEKLYPHMTKDDRLLVIKVTRDYYGWLPEEGWKWLRERQF